MEIGSVEKQSNQLPFLIAPCVNERTFSDFLLHKEIHPQRAKRYSHSLGVSESDKPRSNPSSARTRRQTSQSGALPLFYGKGQIVRVSGSVAIRSALQLLICATKVRKQPQ